MKRISWTLLLLLLLTIPIFIATPSPALATSTPITILEGYAGDHLAPTAASYIGNSNTGKFHYSSCRWVSKMYDSHKVYFERRQDAVNAGYVPCKVCNP